MFPFQLALQEFRQKLVVVKSGKAVMEKHLMAAKDLESVVKTRAGNDPLWQLKADETTKNAKNLETYLDRLRTKIVFWDAIKVDDDCATLPQELKDVIDILGHHSDAWKNFKKRVEGHLAV